MTIREFALNLILNDRDGEYSRRKITADEAADIIRCMDEVPEDITPEALVDAWKDIIAESGIEMEKKQFAEYGELEYLDAETFYLEPWSAIGIAEDSDGERWTIAINGERNEYRYCEV